MTRLHGERGKCAELELGIGQVVAVRIDDRRNEGSVLTGNDNEVDLQ
jgi:hypothetical protein